MALLYWFAATGLVSPIAKLNSAEAFGRGELTTRVSSRRKDEIGDLARSFNQMADRLETLITSERRLLQDVSHELRSPLARLKLATKLARTSSDQRGRWTGSNGILTDDFADERHRGDHAAGGRPVSAGNDNLNLEQLVDSIAEDCRMEAETHGCFLAVSGGLDHPVRGNKSCCGGRSKM